MLAKILEDMWVDPDVLEALSEEQKRVLFVKMREEQVRRWRAREEEEQRGGPDDIDGGSAKTVKSKQVSWLLGRDGDVSVIVIGDTDEFRGCRLLSNVNNRLQSDNLNGIQTQAQSPGNHAEEPGFGQEERTHATDDSSPAASSEDDMDLKETDSSDSDSGSGSEASPDWAPPLYRPHPRLQPGGGGRGGGDELDADLVAVEKPASCGGRVAELRKAFARENPPRSKPPVPTKPLHLHQRTTPPCIL